MPGWGVCHVTQARFFLTFLARRPNEKANAFCEENGLFSEVVVDEIDFLYEFWSFLVILPNPAQNLATP